MKFLDGFAIFDAAMQRGMNWIVKLAELILLAAAFQVIAITTESLAIKSFALVLTMIVFVFAIGPITYGAGEVMKDVPIKSKSLYWTFSILYLLVIAKVCFDLQISLAKMIRTFSTAVEISSLNNV